jgi:hypothetical protein
MSVSIQAGFSVVASASHPILSDGTPSSAVLSNPTFTTSDVNVFTLASDGVTVVSVNPGTATIGGTVTATESDGTVHQIPITPDTVTVTAAPPPPVPQAVAAGVVFGTPFPTPGATTNARKA